MYLLAFVLRSAALACALTLASTAVAQNYPAKPIRLVVPFPAGGTSDILGRILGYKLAERWGQQLIVDPRPGAAGAIGAEAAMRAPADGYTLLITDVGSLLINQILHPKVAYDLTRDFAPVTLVSYSPHLFCVHPSLPAANVAEFIALAKKRPGALNFASSPGGAPFLAGLMFAHRTGIEWTYITGRGGAQSVMDVVSGQANVLFNGMLATLPQVKSGKLRLLAVSSEQRNSALPDVPTIAESGVPGFVTGSWQGILAPRGVPTDIVSKLHTDIARILALPDVKEKLAGQGADPLPAPPAEMERFLREERDRWANLIRETGYKVE
jgi:tripartite-type tricarboxylate transporter receptor subunit TctC